MTLSNKASAVRPFKFQLRRESVDWRRINAVDIDLVMNQMDVNTLQEHIRAVTFCSLDGERCQRCQSPVDPGLLKLFQLAQLTVEWLLHCQEFLTLNLQEAEERLTAASGERKQLLAQQKKQEEKAKALTTELKQRKNFIRTQQSMLMPSILSYPKCPHCDKFFCNFTYLQYHMERRHPEEYEIQLRFDGEKKSQTEILKSEISGLKDQVIRQQQELQIKTAQENEVQSLYKDLLREINRLKAEEMAEMARMDRKLEDSRDGFHRQMEFLYQNIQFLIGTKQNQSAYEKSAIPFRSQAERNVDSDKELQTETIEILEKQIEDQDKKWESKLQDIESRYEAEKNHLLTELMRMQSAVSDQQEHSQRLHQEMERELQEKKQIIRAQEEQLRIISSSPPRKVMKVAVPSVRTLALEPEPKKAVFGVDFRSIPEKRPILRKTEPAPKKKIAVSSIVKSNSSIKKDVRKDIEQAVIMRLTNVRVNPDQRGLKSRESTSLLAKVHSKWKSLAKGKPENWRQREMIVSLVEQKLCSQRRSPLHSSLSPKATRVMCEPAVSRSKTPQLTPRMKPKPKTSLFSSDEETEEKKRSFSEQYPPNVKSGQLLQPKKSKTTRVQSKASKYTSTMARESALWQSLSCNPEPTWMSAGGVTRIAVTKVESDHEEEENG